MALVPFPSVTPGDDEDDDPNLDDSGSKMSFLEHLDELRKRLIYIVYSLIAGCVIAGIFIQRIFDFIMRPMQKVLPGGGYLQYTSGSEPFMLWIKIGFLAGIFIASPLILWQVWKFIAPGLYTPREEVRDSVRADVDDLLRRRRPVRALRRVPGDLAVLRELRDRLHEVRAEDRRGLLALHEDDPRLGPHLRDADPGPVPRPHGRRLRPDACSSTSSTRSSRSSSSRPSSALAPT